MCMRMDSLGPPDNRGEMGEPQSSLERKRPLELLHSVGAQEESFESLRTMVFD